MKWLRSLISKYFFSNLYKKFLNQGWSVVCKTPKYLNIAFPDNSIEYYIASFSNNSICISGIAPYASYISFTIYDNKGQVIYYTFDNEFLDKDRNFNITFPIINKKSTFCIIYRIYQRQSLLKLPTIILNNQKLSASIINKIKENTLSIQDSITNLLSKRFLYLLPYNQQLFLAPSDKMELLFRNPDALYYIAFPDKNISEIIVNGILPDKNIYDKTLRFLGFMTCDYKTTKTFSSISWNQLSFPHYQFTISFSNKSTLYWEKNKDIIPVLIFRQVQINDKIDLTHTKYFPRLTFK